jgi:hypothetical protein
VSRYWPEFAAKGKGEATVAQLLSHQCGLFSVQGEISLAEALDWDTITARLADTEPEWPIGSTHGYHALTYGWLAGELVRRVDPQHRSIGSLRRRGDRRHRPAPRCTSACRSRAKLACRADHGQPARDRTTPTWTRRSRR